MRSILDEAAQVASHMAFAIANAVYGLVSGTLEETSYGKTVARICQVAIVFFGAVAAFGQVGIATTVTTPIMWTVLAMVAGVAIFGETPDRWTIIGSVVIILAGIAALRLSRQPARAQVA